MTTKQFNDTHHYKHLNDIKCCLNCINGRRWSFETRDSEDPSDLSAMCLDEDAPHEPVNFGVKTERKYVGAFYICDKWKKDKDIK
jgi:hypothetical protein